MPRSGGQGTNLQPVTVKKKKKKCKEGTKKEGRKERQHCQCKVPVFTDVPSGDENISDILKQA